MPQNLNPTRDKFPHNSDRSHDLRMAYFKAKKCPYKNEVRKEICAAEVSADTQTAAKTSEFVEAIKKITGHIKELHHQPSFHLKKPR